MGHRDIASTMVYLKGVRLSSRAQRLLGEVDKRLPYRQRLGCLTNAWILASLRISQPAMPRIFAGPNPRFDRH